MLKYQEVVAFIEINKRNPSKHSDEERGRYLNWIKHDLKLYTAGLLKERIRGRSSDPLLSTFRNAVYDSVWYSGESGKLSETYSKVEAGEYNLAA